MSYNPPAGAVGHTVAALLGADPKREMDDDLARFKSLIERGETTAHNQKVTREEVAANGRPRRDDMNQSEESQS